jgi:hypothetical protein
MLKEFQKIRDYSKSHTVVFDPIDDKAVVLEGTLNEVEQAITREYDAIRQEVQKGRKGKYADCLFKGVNDPDILEEAIHAAVNRFKILSDYLEETYGAAAGK